MRKIIKIPINTIETVKLQLLHWAQQFREVVYLDSNNHQNQYSNYDCIVAVDALTSIKTDFNNAFEDLKQYQQSTKDWLFGYLTYDLKNDIEPLISNNFDGLNFPDLYFFQPKKIFLIKNNSLEIQYLNFCDDEMEADLKDIFDFETTQYQEINNAEINIKQRISKNEYSEKIKLLQEQIHLGNCYEANFCMEFFGHFKINPLSIFEKLNAVSKTPFSAFFKNHQHYILSASPERYLKKTNNELFSQPIKGTVKRGFNAEEDEILKNNLKNNTKEISENVMIVDLVRNDLSKTAEKGSVVVEYLCEIQTFLQVHQMVSTIKSVLKPDISIVDALKTTFPMGSMTGVPKNAALQIIENLEETKRGVYSGSIGYFAPSGDFDFNVIIRTILYNAENQYISYSVGSAITSLSDAASEYDECLLKGKAMKGVLTQKIQFS